MKKTDQTKTKGFATRYWIPLHLGLAACLVLALVLGANVLLKAITQHGREIIVPDFTNMTMDEARAEASRVGVKVVESDSVYVRQMRKGAVYNQIPKAGSAVKHGRRIELTTNTRVPNKIAMPSLVGLSMYMAKAELSTRGLTLGKLIYQEDIATNNVLGQLYRGRDIEAGTLILSGSPIDLVVGLSPNESRGYVPNLVGKKYTRAVETIHDNSFNVGKVRFDSSVKTYADTLNAVVFSQKPTPDRTAYTIGREISIELSVDPEKLSR